MKEQNTNIQREFTNWYDDNKHPDHNDDHIYRILLKIINEDSDQYRTPKATKIGLSGLGKLTSKVTDACKRRQKNSYYSTEIKTI